MSKITILNNKYCKLENFTEEVIKKVMKLLSYKMKGVEYTEAYRSGWNGITYLLSKKLEFSIGLLDKIERYLNNNSIDYELVDLRQEIVIEKEIDLTDRFNKIKKPPRQYQLDIVETAFKHKNGIIRAATGSGKTNMISMLVAKINKPTNVYVTGIDLLHQFHQTMTELFDEPIGMIGNGYCDIQRLNVVSIWTAGKALGIKSVVADDEEDSKEVFNESDHDKIIQCLEKSKLHIFDECHTITCDTAKAIYKKISPERIYGFSGTPYRDDGADLLITAILGEQIYNLPASKLIGEGFLTQPIIKFVEVPKSYNSSNSRIYSLVYKEYIVENDKRNKIVFDSTKELIDKGYQVLVLFKHLSHGAILAELFRQSGLECAILSGSDSSERREEVKQKLLSKKINLILASSIFDVGVDISTLSGLVLAGGGKSRIRALQRIGRILRVYPGKNVAAIVDFYDNVKWLRDHSKNRCEIYKSEEGFKLILPKVMKEEHNVKRQNNRGNKW